MTNTHTNDGAIDPADVAAETIQNLGSIAEFHQSKWGTEITDKATTAEVKQAKKASGKAGTYRVNLANGFEKELTQLTRPISRAYHYNNRVALPYKKGERIVPNLILVEYLGEMGKLTQELADAKQALRPRIQALVDRAIALNGDLGRREHYPANLDEIVDAYAFSVEWSPIPTSDAFGNLPEGFETAFTDRYNNRLAQRLSEGVTDACRRLHKLLGDFHKQLVKDKPKFFQDSLDNIREINRTMRMTNLTQDPDLNGLCDAIDMAVQHTTDQIKLNEMARESARLATDASLTILAQRLGLSATPEPAPEQPATPVTPRTTPPPAAPPQPGDPDYAEEQLELPVNSADDAIMPEEAPAEDLLGDLLAPSAPAEQPGNGYSGSPLRPEPNGLPAETPRTFITPAVPGETDNGINDITDFLNNL